MPIFNKIGQILSYLILPAQFYSRAELQQYCDEQFEAAQRSAWYKRITLTAKTFHVNDATHLDGYELSPQDAVPVAQRKVIIHAVGNGDLYEGNLPDWVNEAAYQNALVVGFNYRNVLKSQGQVTCEADLVEDAITVIEHYRNLGYRTENILLSGHSLGAAILTLAAAKIYDADKVRARQAQVPALRLLNNRSFSTLAKEVVYSLLKGTGSALLIGSVLTPFLGVGYLNALGLWALFGVAGFLMPSVFEAMMLPVVDKCLAGVFGRMDALSAYKSLPETAKDYVMAKDDVVICPKASLHAGLKERRAQMKAQIRHELVEASWHRARALKNELNELKDCKLRLKDRYQEEYDAHNGPLKVLTTYHKVRQQGFFASQISGSDVERNKISKLLNA